MSKLTLGVIVSYLGGKLLFSYHYTELAAIFERVFVIECSIFTVSTQ